MQCITFHPNNLVHLHLCQQFHGAQVGSICRIQFRPSDIVVSPDIFEVVLMVSLLNYVENMQNRKYDFL